MNCRNKKTKRKERKKQKAMLEELPEAQATALRQTFEAFLDEATKALTARKQSGDGECRSCLKRWADGRVTVPKSLVADLVELGRSAATEHAFKTGDVVQWKAGLAHRDLGAAGIAVVTQVLPAPRNGAVGGTGYEDEVLDVVVGTFFTLGAGAEHKRVFVELHTEQRRLEPAVLTEGTAAVARELKSMFKKLCERDRPFRAGDVVVWKQGLENKAMPFAGMPSVVVSVEDGTPLLCEGPSTDSPYFCEPLDLFVLTEVNEETSSAVVVGVDSRRMTLAKQ